MNKSRTTTSVPLLPHHLQVLGHGINLIRDSVAEASLALFPELDYLRIAIVGNAEMVEYHVVSRGENGAWLNLALVLRGRVAAVLRAVVCLVKGVRIDAAFADLDLKSKTKEIMNKSFQGCSEKSMP